MSDAKPARPNQELQHLLGEYANGEISREGLNRLEELLKQRPDARKEYIEFFQVHAGLYDLVEEFSQRDSVSETTLANSRGNRQSERRLFWLPVAISFLAACILIACFVFLPPWASDVADAPSADVRSNKTSVSQVASSFTLPDATTTQPIAVISRMVDVVMAPGETALHIGQSLAPQQVTLQSGLVQFDFLNGVTVVVEGTVELELISQTRCKLLRGQARVYASSQEDGFTLETEDATFIDRGTEFGVRVTPGKEAEVHVIDGQVDILPHAVAEATHSVTTGNAMTVSWNHPPQDIGFRPDDFPTINGVAERLSVQTAERFQQWRNDRQEILEDKDLVVFYDFQSNPDNAQQVVNRVSNGLDGTIVGCKVAEGRWPGKESLEFKGFHDRVRINIPGEFDAITLSAWIRIDGFDRTFSSIMLTDYFQDGHIHWQFRSDGRIEMGIRPKHEERILYLSEPELGFDDLGRWFQLVTVFDPDLGKVFHYLDGKLIMSAPIEIGREADYRAPTETLDKLRIGYAELGNWRRKDPGEPYSIRSLNGRMDEFALYSRALSEAEVARLYEIGKP
ncbi:LamG-like jellyroll fold domain-containing protein [Bremerella cremea]|uniref:LamG-like jellyroll fold domain-containing protein n=1 Tax=Bremerella cremea TaxID=1031537 RepID=UPI0031F11F41